MRLVVLAVLAACGSDDPCAGIKGTCVALHITSPTISRIDEIDLDLLYGTQHAAFADQRPAAVSLPVAVPVQLTVPGPLTVSVVAAGKLGGAVLGSGSDKTTVEDGGRARLDIELVAQVPCVDTAHYCGGDKVAGDPDTLYACNPTGAPIAHGTCPGACVVRTGSNDECAAVGGTCTSGYFCGGDMLTGDPSALYSCSNGVGTLYMQCPNGCVVNTAPYKDACR